MAHIGISGEMNTQFECWHISDSWHGIRYGICLTHQEAKRAEQIIKELDRNKQPAENAGNFPNGTIKIGRDGEQWVVHLGKWARYPITRIRPVTKTLPVPTMGYGSGKNYDESLLELGTVSRSTPWRSTVNPKYASAVVSPVTRYTVTKKRSAKKKSRKRSAKKKSKKSGKKKSPKKSKKRSVKRKSKKSA